MRKIGLVASLIAGACATATPGFDTLTPPPPPSLAAASAAPSPAFPSFSFARITAPPRTPTPGPTTARPVTPTPVPADRPVIFVVWDNGRRASDGSIPFLVVLKGFPQNTPVTLDRYRDPTGAQRSLAKVVTYGGQQTTFTMSVLGSTGVYALDYRHPLNGGTQGQVPFTLSKAIADRAAGTTTSSPCPAAPPVAAFDPAAIARTGQSTVVLSGVCTGEIVTFTRIATAAGKDYWFRGDTTTVVYPQGLAWRPSEIYGTGLHRVFLWAKSREISATIEVR
jgi:hypothetical protein